MISNLLMNIREILNRATAQLNKAGSTSPRLDAEILLAASLNADRLELYKNPEKCPAEEESGRFARWLARREQGEPVAYIVGVKEFWSLSFEVNREVLIPRPETEILVEEALQAVKELGLSAPAILEIGTGSGAIIVALARELPGAHLTATDISAAALDLARRNACRHGLEGRIEFLCGSFFEPVSGIFDIVVANPPYIPVTEFAGLPRGVKEYEPSLALLAGEEGTACHREIIAGSSGYLRKGGWLVMEMGAGQGERIARILREAAVFGEIAVRCDYGGAERVIKARKV